MNTNRRIDNIKDQLENLKQDLIEEENKIPTAWVCLHRGECDYVRRMMYCKNYDGKNGFPMIIQYESKYIKHDYKRRDKFDYLPDWHIIRELIFSESDFPHFPFRIYEINCFESLELSIDGKIHSWG